MNVANFIHNKVMDWTPERDNELRLWVATGKSRTWIAEYYTETFGINCTRNMVVGRIYRLKLKPAISQTFVNNLVVRKTTTSEKKSQAAKATASRLSGGRAPNRSLERFERIDPRAPVPLKIPTEELGYYHCKNVVYGETGDSCQPLYCGHHAEDGRFCAYHHDRFYQKVVW